MPSYIVQEAGVTPGSEKEWNGKQRKSIALVFQGGERAEWFALATESVPAPGTTLEGTIEQSQYGPKWKPAYQAKGGGGVKNDPLRGAKIQRQSAQKVAAEVLKHPTFKDLDKEGVKVTLKALIDWVAADTDAVRVQQGQQTLDQAVTTGQVPTSDPAASDIPF